MAKKQISRTTKAGTGEVTVKVETSNKKWYESKTIWTNVLAIVGGVLIALSGELAAGGTLTALGVINTVLRVVTDKGVSFN